MTATSPMEKLQVFTFDICYVRFLWTLYAATEWLGKFRCVLT